MKNEYEAWHDAKNRADAEVAAHAKKREDEKKQLRLARKKAEEEKQ